MRSGRRIDWFGQYLYCGARTRVGVNGRSGDRGLSEQTIVLLMVVAAVLLAMSVVTSLGGGGPAEQERPRASFVFETNGTDVLVTHYGGDALNGSNVYVESASRGVLGSFAGTENGTCAASVTNVSEGTDCLVTSSIYEALYVVWRGPEEADADRLILDRRLGDPTPSPTPTATPTATPTPTITPTPAPTPTPGTGTQTNETATPAPNGTVAPNGTTAPDGTDTPGGPDRSDTPGGTETGGTATPSGTPTATPTGAATPTTTDTPTSG